MTDRSKLLALAEAVVNLTGPDRATDGMIAKAIGAHPCWATVQKDRQPELFTDGKPGLRAREWLAPKYTGSSDTAMTLVPTKPFPELRPGKWWWSVDSLGCDAHVAYENHDAGIPEYSARAATPTLALCAAALRAQAEALA